MRKWISAALAASFLMVPARAQEAWSPDDGPGVVWETVGLEGEALETSVQAQGAPEINGASALLMEKETGEILFEKNSHDRLEPASVTKIMTLLLVMEAIDCGALTLDEGVQVSARAASMGGSQVFLKEGEVMSVHDLIKAVAVASGNDAAVALAERVAGTEEGFVAKMNARAGELGMGDTTFMNCTGLPAPGHLTSAHDIAVMSRELIKNHPAIREYTTIWMDSLRDGQFQLANTNKLVRFYEGCTGLKTGFTAAAGYCMSATAERDGMELIAVVMKAETRDKRNETAKSLLSWGFAGYTVVEARPGQALPPVDVLLGKSETVQPVIQGGGRILIERSQINSVDTGVTLRADVEAPVEAGQKLGELTVTVGGEVRSTLPIVAGEAVERLTMGGIFLDLAARLMMAK